MDPAVAWMNAHKKTQNSISFAVGFVGMAAVVYAIYCIVMLVLHYLNPGITPPLV